MPCNAKENQKTNPPYKSDGASTSYGYNPLKTKHSQKKTYSLPSGRHVVRPRLQGTPPGSETKFRKRAKPNLRECFPDEVLHGIGLEFRRATQGREGGREAVRVRAREDAHVQKPRS
jgi:hypothetical protein